MNVNFSQEKGLKAFTFHKENRSDMI